MTSPILKLTDGTTSISLVTSASQKGFHLDDWLPEIANYKGGGIRRNNSRADGESLSGKQWANVTEEFRTIVDGEDQDAVITTLQNLRRLFEKASDYWTAPWQNEPVWIEASGSCETNTRYSIVIRGHMPQDGNPHAQPFFAEPSIIGETGSGFLISVERQPWWLEQIPGTGICAEASGEQEDYAYNGWAVSTSAPVGSVNDIIEDGISLGLMLAGDTNNVWRTLNGTAWNGSATIPQITVFAIAPNGPGGNLYATGNSGVGRPVWSSADGSNWAFAINGAGWNVTTPNSIIYHTNGNIYVAARGGVNGLYEYDGIAWVQVFSGTPNCVFLASDGYTYLGDGGGRIIRSLNLTDWSEVQDLSVNGISLITELDGQLIAASAGGEIFTSDDGIKWLLTSDQLSNIINDIILVNGIYYLADDGSRVRTSRDLVAWSNELAPGGNCRTLWEYSGNSNIYLGESGDVWASDLANTVTLGRNDTCLDEVFIANKANTSNITHAFVYDAAPVTWTSIFPGTFPANLLPAVPAAGDILYIGTETNNANRGPFPNVIYDIGTPATGVYTIVYEYSQGGAAWGTLNVYDETGSLPFARPGVNGVYWVPPSDWATDTVNGVTGYWIRARVSAISAGLTTPTQQNRNIYTINWPRVDIDDAQVLGDIPALLRIQAHTRSDEDYYDTIDELDLLENRMVVGLRSLDRGSSFVSFINLADEQNPIGISVSAGTGSAFANKLNAPTGRMITHTTPPTGSLSTYADAATITFGPSISRDFYGTYHTYLRAQLVEPSSSPVGDDTDVQVRLSVRSGSGGITKTTKHVRFVGWDKNGETFKDWQLLNLGRIDLPVSDLFNNDELPDEFQIVIQVSSATATSLEVNLYDLVLIPVDEWAGDFIDTALEDDSGVGNGYKLDIDSVTFSKRRIRALVRSADSSELIRASYQPITPGPAILQSNADQRLWFLTARAAYRGEHTGLDNASVLTDDHADFLRAGVKVGQTIFNITDGSSGVVTARTQTTITATLSGGAEDDWDIGDDYLVICNGVYTSEPWNCHSIQLERNSRYLSFRGER